MARMLRGRRNQAKSPRQPAPPPKHTPGPQAHLEHLGARRARAFERRLAHERPDRLLGVVGVDGDVVPELPRALLVLLQVVEAQAALPEERPDARVRRQRGVEVGHAALDVVGAELGHAPARQGARVAAAAAIAARGVCGGGGDAGRCEHAADERRRAWQAAGRQQHAAPVMVAAVAAVGRGGERASAKQHHTQRAQRGASIVGVGVVGVAVPQPALHPPTTSSYLLASLRTTTPRCWVGRLLLAAVAGRSRRERLGELLTAHPADRC